MSDGKAKEWRSRPNVSNALLQDARPSKLTTMNPPTDRLQTLDIPSPRTAIVAVIVLLSQLLGHNLGDGGHDRVDVEGQNRGVDVNGVGIEKRRVVKRWEDGRRKEVGGSEGVLVGAVQETMKGQRYEARRRKVEN